MTIKTALAAAALAITLPITALADSDQSRALVLEALENTLLAGNVDAVDEYYAEDYIQHNPDFPDGIEGQRNVVNFLSNTPGFSAEYFRVIADDDIVAIHARYEGFGPTAVIGFDVFRVEDGLIVEHWDNLIPEAEPNPSGRTQIDGATAITDLDKTETNRALVEEFLMRSMIRQENVDITDYISPNEYIQHNPMVADGLEGFGAFINQMAEQGITMVYDEVHMVIAEGNFVLAMSEGSFAGEPQAFYDLFRIDGGLIVEHWDVIAPMPGPDAPNNQSGKF